MGLVEFLRARYAKVVRMKARSQQQHSYRKVDPTDSMRVEANSRMAQKLIRETLKAADSPGHTKPLPI